MKKKVQTMGEQIRQDYLAWKERELLGPVDVERLAQAHDIPLNRTTLWRIEKGENVRRGTLRNLRALLLAEQH